MAKGTAGKSASGAAMSKYDVEVEARLKALEAQAHKAPSTNHGERLTALENAVKELQSSGGGGDASDHDKIIDLEAKINKLWN